MPGGCGWVSGSAWPGCGIGGPTGGVGAGEGVGAAEGWGAGWADAKLVAASKEQPSSSEMWRMEIP